MKINIINITRQKKIYKNLIEKFLDSLVEEKKYFKLDRERFAKFELTLAAIDNEKIAGLAGLERKLGFVRCLITVHKEYQRTGLGKRFLFQLIDEAKKTHNIIMAVIEEENYRAANLFDTMGFKTVGKRENLRYAFNALSRFGLFTYYVMKMVFPLIKLIDKVRR